MRSICLSLFLASLAVACNGTDIGDDVCQDDHCVCVGSDACVHDCTAGGLDCEVQCASGTSCDVGCGPGEPCDVECSTTTSCAVDCGGATSCDVTCPAGNCTVTNCDAATCDVACGLSGPATRTGTTATCP
jgi:hypothetical protein